MELTKDAKPNSLRFLTREVQELKEQEERVTSHVLTARRCGASWAEVGAILGITRQAAQQKYGKEPRNTSRDHLYTPEENAEADKALAAMQAIAASNEDTVPETPSIFLDPHAPAKAPAKVSRKVSPFVPATRQHGAFLPGAVPAVAQPGTGKGPHLCTGCGDTNHHGSEWHSVEWNDGCRPTKYDPPAVAEWLMNQRAILENS